MTKKPRNVTNVVPLHPDNPEPAVTMEEVLRRVKANYPKYDDDGKPVKKESK